MLRPMFSRAISQISRCILPINIVKTAAFVQPPTVRCYSTPLTGFHKRTLLNNQLALKPQVRGMANHRHKKYIKLAKGYFGRANRCYKVAKMRVEKGRQYAYRDRKTKKRESRKLWIQRINAGSRMYGVNYNTLINRLLRSDIKLNRKVLSELAFSEPLSFRSVVEVAKEAIPLTSNVQQ